ncbi:MAG TPA: hypothetical protein VFA33_10150 [Bryobacteraceae bacterium]|nr:hypothetical protein [Bryobacteraceae bacterium]
MFRSVSGFRSQYGELTLLVASDFDEWKVLILGPGVTIHGGRQFSEGKAKDHARAIAMDYARKESPEGPPAPELDWAPFSPGQWLNWRP